MNSWWHIWSDLRTFLHDDERVWTRNATLPSSREPKPQNVSFVELRSVFQLCIVWTKSQLRFPFAECPSRNHWRNNPGSATLVITIATFKCRISVLIAGAEFHSRRSYKLTNFRITLKLPAYIVGFFRLRFAFLRFFTYAFLHWRRTFARKVKRKNSPIYFPVVSK